MAGNFEKKVSEQMDDFKIRPSEAVWQKVEAQLRKDKRRRWFFFILPLAALLLGGMGYGIYKWGKTNGEPSLPVVSSNANNQTTQTPAVKSNELVNENKQQSNNDDTLSTLLIPLSIEKEKKSPAEGESVLVDKKQNGIVLNKQYIGKKNPPAEKQKSNSASLALIPKPDAIDKSKPIPDNSVGTNPVIISAEEKQAKPKEKAAVPNNLNDNKVKAQEKNDSPGLINENTLSKKTKAHKEAEVQADTIPQPKKSTADNAPSKKWKIYLNAGAGISGITGERIMPVNNSTSGSITGGPAPQGFIYPPESRINMGPGFHFGFLLKKPVDQQTKFVTGLNYAYAGTVRTIGNSAADTLQISLLNYRDISYSNSYLANGSDKYKTHYQFIELPLLVEHTVGKKQNWGYYAGIAPSVLIASNALIYDNRRGRYYQSNEVYRNFNLQIKAGMFFNPKQNKQLHWGPQLSYGLLNNFNQSVPKQRLFTLGLQLQWRLNK